MRALAYQADPTCLSPVTNCSEDQWEEEGEEEEEIDKC